MKYFSEITNKFYDSVEELENHEREVTEREAEKKAKEEQTKKERTLRAKEVEDALEKAAEAHRNYLELRNKFVRDYGSYHYSYTSETPLTDWLTSFFEF